MPLSTEDQDKPEAAGEEKATEFEALPPGTVIAGRYEIERLLGVGAMGSVYLARDSVLENEQVAVKVLHAEFSHSPNYSQRFLREVQIMRRISHPNVVRTFDVGSDRDIVYFTMEYIGGQSLDKFIGEQYFSYEEIQDLIEQICEALNAIHTNNIVHRDLKPENIIINDEKLVKITDFGVARPEVSKLTQQHEVVGSAGYMAPEVWLGKRPKPSVDLYSLGVVIYELVSGQLPFDAESPGVLMRLHLDRQPEPLKNLKPDVPVWLNRLVMRLLAKSAQERPKSALEIIDYLKTHGVSSSENAASPDLVENVATESTAFLEQLERMSQTASEQSLPIDSSPSIQQVKNSASHASKRPSDVHKYRPKVAKQSFWTKFLRELKSEPSLILRPLILALSCFLLGSVTAGVFLHAAHTSLATTSEQGATLLVFLHIPLILPRGFSLLMVSAIVISLLGGYFLWKRNRSVY